MFTLRIALSLFFIIIGTSSVASALVSDLFTSFSTNSHHILLTGNFYKHCYSDYYNNNDSHSHFLDVYLFSKIKLALSTKNVKIIDLLCALLWSMPHQPVGAGGSTGSTNP